MIELKTAEKTAHPNLLPGGVIGNRGGGRPKSKIRERAGRVYDAVLKEFEVLIDRHMRAIELKESGQAYDKSDLLSASELGKIASEVKTIGVGELKDVSNDSDTYLQVLADVLSELIPDTMALQVYDLVVERLKDVA